MLSFVDTLLKIWFFFTVLQVFILVSLYFGCLFLVFHLRILILKILFLYDHFSMPLFCYFWLAYFLFHEEVSHSYLLFLRLSTERTKTSVSECSAIISAFFECLRFIMQQNLGEEEIEDMLVNDQVRVCKNCQCLCTLTVKNQAPCILMPFLLISLVKISFLWLAD